MRDGVVVGAIANDGGRESLEKFGASFERFLDGLRAAGIVIAGVDAKLIDGGSSAKNAEGVEKMDGVAAPGEADGDCRAVNSGAGNGDFQRHEGSEVDFDFIRRQCNSDE